MYVEFETDGATLEEYSNILDHIITILFGDHCENLSRAELLKLVKLLELVTM